MSMVLVHTDLDQFYRKTLVEVAPASIRPKIAEALAQGPHLNGRAHAQRYFGDAFADVIARAVKIAAWLDAEIPKHRRAPGSGPRSLIDWLDATGFGNDYRLIKAFAAWEEMGRKPTTH